MVKELENSVSAHYGIGGLADAILDALAASGADLDRLTIKDLAPVDEFHTAGRITTLKALEMTPLEPGMHVLDAGSGIGGTARCLAGEFGCRVTGIDLTPEYVEVATLLTDRLGLSETCGFRQGSVLDMPFDDAEFDAALSFHVAMNIDDRPRFYSELARVMQPGAPLCLFDVTDGPTEGMLYPVPWAETEATSFLRSADETKSLLEGNGFVIEGTESLRDFAIDYFREVFASATGGPPPLGLHLLTGDNAAEKFGNYFAALEADQVDPMILVARRASV